MPLIREGGGGRCVSSEEPFVFAYSGPCASRSRRAFNGRTLPRYIAHQLIHVLPSPIIFSAHVFPALLPPPETRLLIGPLLPASFFEVLNALSALSLYHSQVFQRTFCRDFLVIALGRSGFNSVPCWIDLFIDCCLLNFYTFWSVKSIK